MRTNWVVLAGLAFLSSLGPGCTSSDGTTGGTNSTGTSAGSSGGTTGGGSTTGTTGGGSSGGSAGGGKAAGAPCSGNAECASALCGINDSSNGHCCTVACSNGDATCGAKDCDTSGACAYPPSTHPCGASTCTGNILTPSACDGAGACVVGSPNPCPGNLVCGTAGACLAQCTSGTAECVTGFYCSGGQCVAQLAAGQPCTSDVACASTICGVNGSGSCCVALCDPSDPICGAMGCDGRGACVFPSTQVVCSAPSCSGDTLNESTNCDGAGSCLEPVTTDCTPYACTGTPSACATTCSPASAAADCASGAFCDPGSQACCSGLANGGTLKVDATTGSDAVKCCGIGANQACQTLTQAMALIDAAQAKNVTIAATVNGGGGDWTPAETYPIVLGWGVELSAPGVFFVEQLPSGHPLEVLDIAAAYSANDTVGYASIAGSALSPVGVGMDSANSQQTDAVATIRVESGAALYLANASVNDSQDNPDSLDALFVAAGATLVLGQDQSGAVTGTVTIGNALGAEATDGKRGIFCDSDIQTRTGCTLKDAALKDQSSVVIQGQEYADLIAEDFANISLTSNPVIGVPPNKVGFNQCPQKKDARSGAGVWLIGQTSATFNNGVVQCLGGVGFLLQASVTGTRTPTLSIDNTIVQNTDYGIFGQGGTATLTNSTIRYNVIGVQQTLESNGANGSVDLSGGGNTVICSSNTETSAHYTFPGIDILNTSTANLNASNVAWDTATPDYFDCNSIFSCTCNNVSGCTTGAGSDDMDAVEDTTTLGGITTTGATQSTSGCN